MSNAKNKSDWFEGLKCAELMNKDGYSLKSLNDSYWLDIKGKSSEDYCLGFLDYIDHLENRLCLQP